MRTRHTFQLFAIMLCAATMAAAQNTPARYLRSNLPEQ